MEKLKFSYIGQKMINSDIYRSKNNFWKISYIDQYSISYIGQYTTILISTDICLHISWKIEILKNRILFIFIWWFWQGYSKSHSRTLFFSFGISQFFISIDKKLSIFEKSSWKIQMLCYLEWPDRTSVNCRLQFLTCNTFHW